MRTGSAVCGALIAAAVVAGFAADARADALGVWLTGTKKAQVKIYPCSGDRETLCGEIVWLQRPLGEDGKPKRDIHNEDEALRDRPLMGIQVVWDLAYQGDGEWDDGEIYNAEDGETYDAEMEEIDANTLEVSGCVWFICKTQTWERIE